MVKTPTPTRARALRYPKHWPALIDQLVTVAVVPGDRPDTIRTKRLFTTAMWASVITSIVSILLLNQNDAPWAAAATAIPMLTAVISLVAMWITPSSYPGVMHLVVGGTIVTSVITMVLFGGIFESAGAATWGMLAVIGGVAVFGDRRAHVWLVVFGFASAIGVVLSRRIEPIYEFPNPDILATYNLAIISLFIYVMLFYFVKQSDTLFQQAESLLRNVLPDEIAERLKKSEDMIADEFESASIMFADVVGFTPMAARMSPGDVVDLLNRLFTAFDQMVEVRDLEKIKTVGDAYMVAAGVPVPRDDHTRAICELALAMQTHVQSHTFGSRQIAIRVGIASGPVTAGIIGTKKFSYDLWGDTVNLASRMESTGVPGRIQLDAGTRKLIDPWFECERRGVIDVSGKGQLETYFLVGEVGS